MKYQDHIIARKKAIGLHGSPKKLADTQTIENAQKDQKFGNNRRYNEYYQQASIPQPNTTIYDTQEAPEPEKAPKTPTKPNPAKSAKRPSKRLSRHLHNSARSSNQSRVSLHAPDTLDKKHQDLSEYQKNRSSFNVLSRNRLYKDLPESVRKQTFRNQRKVIKLVNIHDHDHYSESVSTVYSFEDDFTKQMTNSKLISVYQEYTQHELPESSRVDRDRPGGQGGEAGEGSATPKIAKNGETGSSGRTSRRARKRKKKRAQIVWKVPGKISSKARKAAKRKTKGSQVFLKFGDPISIKSPYLETTMLKAGKTKYHSYWMQCIRRLLKHKNFEELPTSLPGRTRSSGFFEEVIIGYRELRGKVTRINPRQLERILAAFGDELGMGYAAIVRLFCLIESDIEHEDVYFQNHKHFKWLSCRDDGMTIVARTLKEARRLDNWELENRTFQPRVPGKVQTNQNSGQSGKKATGAYFIEVTNCEICLAGKAEDDEKYRYLFMGGKRNRKYREVLAQKRVLRPSQVNMPRWTVEKEYLDRTGEDRELCYSDWQRKEIFYAVSDFLEKEEKREKSEFALYRLREEILGDGGDLFSSGASSSEVKEANL